MGEGERRGDSSAASALWRLGAPGAQATISLLESPNRDVRLAAAVSLGKGKDPSAVAPPGRDALPASAVRQRCERGLDRGLELPHAGLRHSERVLAPIGFVEQLQREHAPVAGFE